MSRKIEDLNPDTQKRLASAMAEMRLAGVDFFVSSTLRTSAEQAAYFAQGRSSLEIVNSLRSAAGMTPITSAENTYKVTNCDGVKYKSVHQSGNAVDIVPLENGRPVWPELSDARWHTIALIMQSHGFRWGGDWNGDGKTRADGDLSETMVDYPHYERKA